MPELAPRIDHVVINVLAGLDEAAERYRRLGFILTPRGHHTLGTSNHLAIFGTDYLELLGFDAGNARTRPDLIATPPGLSGLVFKPPADPGFAAALTAAGVPAEAPREFSRPVELPDGTAPDARFRTVTVPGAVAQGRVFFCHHYTPELVWRDEWQHHANGVSGIAGMTIAAADPAGAAAVFGRMFGPAALHPVEDGVALQAGSARVLLLTPEGVVRRHGAVAAPLAEAGRMVALDLRTTSLDSARVALQAGGIAAQERDGNLVVAPDDACGTVLTFAA